jgi:hypothetical protein
MPINSPDSFQSLGTAIVNGGETTQITEVTGADGIVTSRSAENIVTISQPALVRPKSTALDVTGVGTGAGSTGDHSILYYDWQADGATIDYEAGEIVYWRTDFNKWARAGAGSYETSDSGTLLLGMATSSSSGAKVVRRGFVRCDVGFNGVPIGTPCYLWFQGTVTTSKPTFHNYSQRLVGWTVDQDASAGLMFFSPDVNYTIRA